MSKISKLKESNQLKEQKSCFRVSTRELVEFTYFQEDIFPSSGMEDMRVGTHAHQARQRMHTGEVECSISYCFDVFGESITVYGRMDAFKDGEVPFVEEIKLGRNVTHLNEPILAHRAQAVVYAAMVALKEDVQRVDIAVCYVNEKGEVVNNFSEQLLRDDLLMELEGLLRPYITFLIAEKVHKQCRDESVRRLKFPFPAYREGQRELSAQVYTAIVRKKRLFASLPTGTGKSVAVLYPAMKALAEDKTGKLLYLTARTTARQSPLAALEKMLAMGMRARVMTLSAKEKMCAGFSRCHPMECPRAKGHYLRQQKAWEELLQESGRFWTDEYIRNVADRHQICPFEFALMLTERADVVLMDLNYAFDPFAQLKRMFQFQRNFTLLVDEAHHTVDRVRESLSGSLNSRIFKEARIRFGKATGKKHPYYVALGGVIRALCAVDTLNGEQEGRLLALPDAVRTSTQTLCMAAYDMLAAPVADTEIMADVSTILRMCSAFIYATEHMDEDYAILLEKRGCERNLELYCLFPGKEIARITKRIKGTVFFSATMQPLRATRSLLGGEETDACFSLSSPFPNDNLHVVRRRINTRYQARIASACSVAESIAQMTVLREGKYIAYFPSYAYLKMVQGFLQEMDIPPLWVQRSDMDDEERRIFLEGFSVNSQPKLGLCVLGSLYSEGIDLPGDQLIGVAIVGVGLPVPTLRLKMVQECYSKHFIDGFEYACRIPGMQKVLQAAGRVIRTETDKGVVVLLDERYYDPAYVRLLPEYWTVHDEII